MADLDGSGPYLSSNDTDTQQLGENRCTRLSQVHESRLAATAMSKKRAGSASRPGTPANDGDSGSEDDFKPQQAANKGKQAMSGSKGGAGGGPGGSGSGNGAPAGADDDMNTLDDAVGYAGVDLNVRLQQALTGDSVLIEDWFLTSTTPSG